MIRALVFEWRRLISVRSTYIISGLYLALVGLLAAVPVNAIDNDYQSEPRLAMSWQALYSTPSFILCAVVISVVAAQTFGHEYRYGLIRLTLSEFPNRGRVVLAKTIMLMLYALLMTILAWGVLWVIGTLAPDGAISDAGLANSPGGATVPHLWFVPLFSIGYCVFAMAVTLLTRNLPLGITLPLLLAAFVESLVIMLLDMANGKLAFLSQRMPLNNAMHWLAGDGTQHGIVFGCWVVGLFALSTALFIKRDA